MHRFHEPQEETLASRVAPRERVEANLPVETQNEERFEPTPIRGFWKALRSIEAPGQRWAALARLPIRTRRPYCARHSCVSWNLMLGKNPLWVARQHGHTIRTMLEVYAAWADGAVESDVQVIRRSMGLPANSSTRAWWGLLGGLAQRLFGHAAEGRHAAPRFSIWHWIWHQERGACT